MITLQAMLLEAREKSVSYAVSSFGHDKASNIHQVYIRTWSADRETTLPFFVKGDDTPLAIAQALTEAIYMHLHGGLLPVSSEEVASPAAEVKEEPIPEIPPVIEAKAPKKRGPKAKEAAPVEEVKEEPKKSKVTLYDPELADEKGLFPHRVLLSSALNNDPRTKDWKKHPNITKISREIMKGDEFLDENGLVLQSFKEKLYTQLGV